MISFNHFAKSASGLALALSLTSDSARAVPVNQYSGLANLSSLLQDALDFEGTMMPYDDYEEEAFDPEGHHYLKSVHKHKYDDGIDIDLMTNEDVDPVGLI